MFNLIVKLRIVLEHQCFKCFNPFWVSYYLFNLCLFGSPESNRVIFIRLLSIRILTLSWVDACSFISIISALSAVLSSSRRGWWRLVSLCEACWTQVEHLLSLLKPLFAFIVYLMLDVFRWLTSLELIQLEFLVSYFRLHFPSEFSLLLSIKSLLFLFFWQELSSSEILNAINL